MTDTDAGPHEEACRVLPPTTSVRIPLSFGGPWGADAAGVRGSDE